MLTRRKQLVLLFSFVLMLTVLATSLFIPEVIAGKPASITTVPQNPSIANSGLLPWQFDIVDMPGYFDYMSDRSLRYDSVGNLHLVYGGDRLYHATFDGAAWQIEIVDENVGTGMGASLDLDAGDRLHIAYLDMVNYKLKYAHWTGEAWTLQTLDRAYGYSERTSIAIDSAGRPHIAYKKNEWLPPDYNCPGMGYAHWAGDEWLFERFSDCGNFVSMALDTAGNPHIAFYDSAQIKYASKLDGNWNIGTIGTSSGGYGSSLALDADDRPHVAYIDGDGNGQLIYAYWDGNSWIPETIQPADAGLYVSLTIDNTGTSHIAYGSQHITWPGGQRIETNTSYVEGTFSSIALDSENRPAISYLGWSAVYCKRWDGAEWLTDTLDWAGDAGLRNALALDGNGHPHISYYSRSANAAGLIYTRRYTETWLTETITVTYFPAYPDSSYDVSMALDSQDVPHVSFWYSDWHEAGLYYGKRVGDVWQTEIIADDADSPSKLVIDSMDRPHVAFVDNATLKYGYRTEGGWIIDDVVSGVIPSIIALALDDDGRPRIVYAGEDYPDVYLKYAAWTGVEWQQLEVDVVSKIDTYVTYGSASLVLDEAGNPHIGYVIAGDGENQNVVKYAFWDGYSWTTETVDARQWGFYEVSILLNDDGYPILTYAYSGRILLVATLLDGVWRIEEVTGVQCGDLSAATDGRDLFISYYNGRGHGLVLAEPIELAERHYLPIVVKS